MQLNALFSCSLMDHNQQVIKPFTEIQYFSQMTMISFDFPHGSPKLGKASWGLTNLVGD